VKNSPERSAVEGLAFHALIADITGVFSAATIAPVCWHKKCWYVVDEAEPAKTTLLAGDISQQISVCIS
jgi:hypothetical protein